MNYFLPRSIRFALLAVLAASLPAGAVEKFVPRLPPSAAHAPSAPLVRAPGLGAIASAPSALPASVPAAAAVNQAPPGFILNDEGVYVGGINAEQYRWIRGMADRLAPRMNLGETLDVMFDSIDEARAKLVSVEKAAAQRKIAETSVHLEDRRTWVDAVMVDGQGRTIPHLTQNVYFHPAPDNPASEIAEGKRRADKYLVKTLKDFEKGGFAEKDFKTSFGEVSITFIAHHPEIEQHLRAKEPEIRKTYGDRFKFDYVTEARRAKDAIRAEYNRIVERYRGQAQGLVNIINGVLYSRYVGVGHELTTHEDSLNRGNKVLIAGRDFFADEKQPDGTTKRVYKTEFDGVNLTPQGVVELVEAKSMRVPLPLNDAMEETFLYKLRIYQANRDIIEKYLGSLVGKERVPLNVLFTVDVGGLNRRAAREGLLVWHDPRQKALFEHLKHAGEALSREYGFPVAFRFLNSHPGEDPLLFYKEAMDEGAWYAAQKKKGKGKR